MSQIVFTDDAAKRIATVVRDHEKNLPRGAPAFPELSRGGLSWFAKGKLTSPLARGSFAAPESATFKFWRRNAETGLREEGEHEYAIEDDGFLPSAYSPLQIGQPIFLAWCDGGWQYAGHDCDYEAP